MVSFALRRVVPTTLATRPLALSLRDSTRREYSHPVLRDASLHAATAALGVGIPGSMSPSLSAVCWRWLGDCWLYADRRLAWFRQRS